MSRACATAEAGEAGPGSRWWSRLCVWALRLALGGHVLAAPLPAQRLVGLGNVTPLSDGISVRTWTVEQGLPQSAVTELVTDRDGYLWGATFGGLFRFDGRTLQSYSATEVPVLTSNSATALSASRDDLWIGTPNGTIARLRRGQFVDSLPTPPHDQASTIIDQLLADRPGEVWMREGDDVHRFANGRWAPRLPYQGRSPLLRDRDGRVLYLGPQGLVRVDERGRAAIVARPDTGAPGLNYGLHVDAADRVWMGLPSGLWVLDRETLRRVFSDSTAVGAVTTDSTGDVWFAAGPRLLRYRPGATGAVRAAVQPILDAGTEIIAIAPLHDGLLAAGTREGLLIVRRNAARLLRSPRGIPNIEAGSIVGPGDGTVYVTSGCSDVFRLAAGGRVLDSIARPDARHCARSLLLDARGLLWVGGQGTILRYRTAHASERATTVRDTLFSVSSFLGEPPGVEVLQADGASVLFGLSDGRVGRIEPSGRLEFLSGWSVPTDVPVLALARTADSAVWIAQTGMWSRWKGGELAHYHAIHGVPNAVPRALLPDNRGGLWVGTYGSGLWYFRVGTGARAVPLPDRTVSGLIADRSGRLWMPGNRGISVVPLASLYRFLADSAEIPGVKLLSYAEGVPEGNNGRPAAAVLDSGRFAFASIQGLVEVNTAEVLTAGVTPPVRIDSIRTGAGRTFDPTAPVRLPPDDRVLQVGFSAPSYRFADGVRFRYRLDGRDDHWVAVGASRDLRLAGLRPGRYTLYVEGRVPGGEWRAARPLDVEVVPLFAEQRWPWLVGGAVAVLLVGLVVRQRVRATQATAHAREVELRARRDAAESAEQHQREMAQVSRVAVAGELTASLSHELGQPLAAIVNNAEAARRLLARQAGAGGAAGLPPAVDEALRDVVLQGHRASQVVREFRRFLRRERGERELIPVRELLESTTLLLRHEFVESRVQLEVRVAADVPPVLAERVLLQQVFVNLLHNAHEAARGTAQPQVLVRARAVRGGVRVSVVDSGLGFPPSVRRSAFEPFVTTRPNGMGMGLAIARRVVDAHRGQLRIGRLPGAGAVVSVWLPAGHIPAQHRDELTTAQGSRHG